MLSKTSDFIGVTADKIRLDMHMDGQSFAKARLMQYLTSPGWIVTKNTETGEWNFTSFVFSGTEDIQDNLYVTAPGFDGVLLYDLLTDESRRYAEKAHIIDLLQDISDAAKKARISIPRCGPAGTIVGHENNFLFLPAEFIERSLKKESDTAYSQFLGCWINESFNQENSFQYTVSVYAYFTVAGALPFPNTDSQQRHEDWYDSSFIPCGTAAVRADPIEAQIITENLMPTALSAGLKKIPVMKHLFSSQEKVSEQEIQERKARTEKDLQKKMKKLNVKRVLRKKHILVKSAAAAAVIGIIILITAITANSSKPTTKGLSSLDTVKTFYTAMNTQDVDLLTRTMARNTGKYYIEMISGFYITGKMRSMYETEAGTLPPQQWFWLKTNSNYWMFGITGLSINGIQINPQVQYFTVREKPSAVTEENGQKLKTGDKKQYTAQYYLVRTEGTSTIIVSRHKDTMELEYRQNKWIITDISGKYEEVPVSSSDFFLDFAEASAAGLDVPAIAEKLRTAYSWVPSSSDIKRGEDELRKRFTSKYIVK